MKREFAVPADAALGVISFVGLIVILSVIWLLISQAGITILGVAVIALLVVTVAVSLALTPLKIIIDDRQLIIKRVVGSKKIDKDAITEACKQEFTPADIRVFGNGGLFSYIGWYYSRRKGYYYCYLRSRNNLVFVETRNGRKYMLGCDNPDNLLGELSVKNC